MTRLFLLAATLSLALGLVSTREMWAQEKETVGSLAAKGFEVKGVSASPGAFVVAMQKGVDVYVCSAEGYLLLPSCRRQK